MEKTFKQKAVIAGYVIGGLVLFIGGGIAVPKIEQGFKLFFPDPKPYVAPMSDFEEAVKKAMSDPKNQETYRHNITAIVALDWANKYMGITKKEQLQSDYAIPDSLVTAINATETARKK